MNKEEKNAEKFFNSLINYAEETNKEIERLNNIINELEVFLKRDILTIYRSDGKTMYRYQEVLDKLKELKEGK